ncbi:MAG: hypothetical protein AABZ64_07170 [Nitrospinota bacterium]
MKRTLTSLAMAGFVLLAFQAPAQPPSPIPPKPDASLQEGPLAHPITQQVGKMRSQMGQLAATARANRQAMQNNLTQIKANQAKIQQLNAEIALMTNQNNGLNAKGMQMIQDHNSLRGEALALCGKMANPQQRQACSGSIPGAF